MAPSGECLWGYKPRAADCSHLAPRVAASCLAKPSCYRLLHAGITRYAVLRGTSLCLCIVSVVEHCDLTDIKGKIYFIYLFVCFSYLRHTLDQYVENDYTLVYFHHGLDRRSRPSFAWLRQAYSEFDRK